VTSKLPLNVIRTSFKGQTEMVDLSVVERAAVLINQTMHQSSSCVQDSSGKVIYELH